MRRWFVRNGRLRSGWRVVTYLIVATLLLLAVSIATDLALAFYLLSHGTPASELTARLLQILLSPTILFPLEILQLAITLAVVLVWRRWLDKKSFRSLGLELAPGWWQDFLLGAGLIALTWCAIFLFSLAASAITVTAARFDLNTFLGGLGVGLVFNLVVAFNEEIGFRGYVLQNLAEGVHLAPAILLSSLIFGAEHLANPGATAASTLGVTLFGVLAGLAWWATGRLWMPIGMHAAWNWFEGPVFGFPVSGLNLASLFAVRINGPSWLMGGAFGPESGLLTMAPLLVLITLISLWARRRRGLKSSTANP